MALKLPPVYPILDSRYFPEGVAERTAFVERVTRELIDAGATLLQLRSKGATREQVLRDAAAMRHGASASIQPSSVQLILNDYAALTREAGFDGAHLGQGDTAIGRARAELGPSFILGLSTHTAEQVARGEQTSADYLAVGPVFSTSSKADAEPVIGVEGVRAARERTAKPLVAIGGITPENVEQVWAAGADSVAVLSGLWRRDSSPGAMVRDFLRLFR